MSSRTLIRLAKRYRSEGLACLYYRPRVGRPPKTDQELEDKIVVLSCSEAPKGYSQWSLRLLADQAVVLGYCDKISHTQVAKILKKRKLKPHLIKTWCIGVINAAFIVAMENILRLYALEYDSDYPLISFDERPCFLIGDKVEGLAVKSGAIKKEDYEYVKNGSCTLFAAIEPLTGKRFAKVYNYRRKIEYANFMKIASRAVS